MAEATVVIPCYQEERRLQSEALLALAATDGMQLLIVDDGSTDRTPDVVAHLAETSDSIEVLTLARNSGKAEAVRAGLTRAIAGGASIVGYYDADLSTPPAELLRLIDHLVTRPELEVVMAARVALLGRRIERRARRHYLGRVFATFASLSLDIPVYDTQCGAKAMRVSPTLEAALAKPFRSRWSFDVELLARLLFPAPGVAPTPLESIAEVPLREWRDVSGSKLGPTAMARAAVELAQVAREARRSPSWRRTHGR
ncbi:MAG: glycosyltransferase [Gaiellales bacterium]